MSHRDKEPASLTIVKAIGAVILVLVALAFGAGGACGAVVAVQGLWSTTSRRSTVGYDGIWVYGAICAVVGLGGAGLLVWGAIAIFKKKEDRYE